MCGVCRACYNDPSYTTTLMAPTINAASETRPLTTTVNSQLTNTTTKPCKKTATSNAKEKPVVCVFLYLSFMLYDVWQLEGLFFIEHVVFPYSIP